MDNSTDIKTVVQIDFSDEELVLAVRGCNLLAGCVLADSLLHLLRYAMRGNRFVCNLYQAVFLAGAIRPFSARAADRIMNHPSVVQLYAALPDVGDIAMYFAAGLPRYIGEVKQVTVNGRASFEPATYAKTGWRIVADRGLFRRIDFPETILVCGVDEARQPLLASKTWSDERLAEWLSEVCPGWEWVQRNDGLVRYIHNFNSDAPKEI